MKKGFTLIELLVVVLIIGILSAVALPMYQKTVWKSRSAQLYTAVRALATAQEAYYMANGEYSDNFSNLDISFDAMQKSNTSDFGNITSTDAVRYNDFFELYINKNGSGAFHFSVAVFRTGPYRGGAILFAHESKAANLENKKMYCLEGSVGNSKNSFCKKVMGVSSTAISSYGAYFYAI